LDQPEHEVLGHRGRRVLGGDPRGPLATNARRRHCGQSTFCGGGGLHITPGGQDTGSGWTKQVSCPSAILTVTVSPSVMPGGHLYACGRGGLHRASGGHAISICASQWPPLMLTVHCRSS